MAHDIERDAASVREIGFMRQPQLAKTEGVDDDA